MANKLFDKYLNIQKFITKYRKLNPVESFINESQFKKQLKINSYIYIPCKSEVETIHIYLLEAESRYIKTTAGFIKLLESFGSDMTQVILITKLPLSIYINKVIPKYPAIHITNYLHRLFTIELTKGPFCSTHTVLTDEEMNRICFKELMIHPLSIPPIFENDPMCIWIGAKLGQMVKIESKSENAGSVIRYRIVTKRVITDLTPAKTKKADKIDIEDAHLEIEKDEKDDPDEDPEVEVDDQDDQDDQDAEPDEIEDPEEVEVEEIDEDIESDNVESDNESESEVDLDKKVSK